MQINVMPWLTLAWLFALLAARGALAAPAWRRWPASRRCCSPTTSGASRRCAASITRWRRAFEQLERRADPARTVFVVHDFDWVMTYGSLHWGDREPGVDRSARRRRPAEIQVDRLHRPAAAPPGWIDRAADADLRRQIDRALELGYDVLVVRLWHIDQDQLEPKSA